MLGHLAQTFTTTVDEREKPLLPNADAFFALAANDWFPPASTDMNDPIITPCRFQSCAHQHKIQSLHHFKPELN
jgi:hypothetical protein